MQGVALRGHDLLSNVAQNKLHKVRQAGEDFTVEKELEGKVSRKRKVLSSSSIIPQGDLCSQEGISPTSLSPFFQGKHGRVALLWGAG